MSVVRELPVPLDASAPRALDHVDYADTFNVHIDSGGAGLPERYAREMFANLPQWVALLTRLRDFIASLAGLK